MDDAVLGRGDEVRVADRHAQEHAEREREQDGGEGQRVVAVVEHRSARAGLALARRRTAAAASATAVRRRRAGRASSRRRRSSRSAPAAITTSSGVSPGRGRYRRLTPLASTRISPMRRRVRNVEDMPLRLRSRNSTRLNCEPTDTISRAPFSAAISIATSWLVPGAGTSLNASPSSSRRSRPGARPSPFPIPAPTRRRGRSARRAPRRSAARPRSAESMSPTIMSGVSPASSTASAPPSTATISGRMSRMNGRSARRSRWWLDATDDHQRRAIAEVGREARHLDPAGEQLALLAHVLDRVVGEALERLADLAPARLGFRAHALEVEHLAAREHLALAQHLRTGPRDRLGRLARNTYDERVAVGDRVEQRVVGQVDEHDPRLDQQLRTEVGIGAAGGRAAVEHRDGARGDQLLGGDAVDVLVVDQRDVTAHEVPDEQLRAPARAHRPGDARHARQRRRERWPCGLRGGHSCESNARTGETCSLRALRQLSAARARACGRPCRRCRRRACARAR